MRRRGEVRERGGLRATRGYYSLCVAFFFKQFCCGVRLPLLTSAYLRISQSLIRLRRTARTFGRAWAASSVRRDAEQCASRACWLPAAALRPAAAALRPAARLQREPRRHARRWWPRVWGPWWKRKLRCAARASRELCSTAPHGAVPGGRAAACAAVWSAKQQRMEVSDAFQNECALVFFLS